MSTWDKGGLEEIARERMKNTGEDYATAVQTVIATRTFIIRDSETDYAWLKEHIEPRPAPKMPQEGLEWLLSLPPSVAALIHRFPPACVVTMKPEAHGLIRTGIVMSYTEDEQVSFCPHPESSVRVFAMADDLEVVGYHNGMTPDWVASQLGV